MSQNVETSFGGDAYLRLHNRLRQKFRKSLPADWERLEKPVSVAPAAVEPDAFVAEPIPVDAAAMGSGFAGQLAPERDAAAAVVVAVERAWPVSSGSHFAPGEAQARALAVEPRFHCQRCCGSRRDRSVRRDDSNAPWASKSAAALFFERAFPELVEAKLERGEERDSAEEQEPA